MNKLLFFLPVLCLFLLFSQLNINSQINIFERQINFYFISNDFSDLDARDKENKSLKSRCSILELEDLFNSGICSAFSCLNTNLNIFLISYFKKIINEGNVFLKIFSSEIIKKFTVLVSQFKQKEKYFLNLISHLKLPEIRKFFISGFSYLYLTARGGPVLLFLRC